MSIVAIATTMWCAAAALHKPIPVKPSMPNAVDRQTVARFELNDTDFVHVWPYTPTLLAGVAPLTLLSELTQPLDWRLDKCE